MNKITRAAEMAARHSYGKLLAFLAARTSDIHSAEDALADAFAKALVKWPQDGVPDNPDAWLLTVARNKLTDKQRYQLRFDDTGELEDMPIQASNDQGDTRLPLMMVCTHPAIASDLHTPLMLQTVLGIDAKTIAKLFLVSPQALTKRLVRAKAKIRDAAIPFELPDADQLPLRSTAIFEAIYALHAHDWLAPEESMGEEALYLADLLTKLMSDNAEALGLAALIGFAHARCEARVQDGMLVPTAKQDASLWHQELIHYAERQLNAAQKLGSIGRFQIEAAIEQVHVHRHQTGKTDWPALNQLYFALNKIAPSVGAMVAQATVTGKLHGANAALKSLDEIEKNMSGDFQPFWAAKAHWLKQSGDKTQAQKYYDKAISHSREAPLIRFLQAQRDALN